MCVAEHEDDFPKPELEIDVTPVVKKSKRRKRAIKQQDDDVVSSNFSILQFVDIEV